jgi:hypothetical protein
MYFFGPVQLSQSDSRSAAIDTRGPPSSHSEAFSGRDWVNEAPSHGLRRGSDNDGRPDKDQGDIECVNTVIGAGQVAMKFGPGIDVERKGKPNRFFSQPGSPRSHRGFLSRAH